MKNNDIKVLIVDDEEFIRISLVAFLEDEGFQIYSANSAEQAMELVDQHNFDLGIIDMKLPGIDGNTLILELHKKNPSMKFIIHTGSVNYQVPRKLIALGINNQNILLKPVKNLDVILNKIYTVLKKFNSDDN